MKPYDLIVVMPVYNEAEAIGPVLKKWQAMLDTLNIRYQIRAYNDGSKDNTGAILKEVSSASDGRILGVDKANSGHGPTILRGYREAAREAEWVFQIDSDDEMGPESFPKLWSMREEYDFLVGQRDGRRQPLPRKIISFVSRLCVRIFYGKGIWDVNTPYRLMRVDAFQSYYEAIPDSTFAPNVILSGLAARNGLRMTEIPVPQHDRTTGEVSIKKWKLLKAAVRSFAQTIDFSFDGHGWIAVAYPLIFLTWCAKIQFSVIANDYGYNIHVVNLMNKGLWPLVDFHSMYTQLLYWIYLPLKMVTGCYFGYTLLLFVNGLISFLVACWVYRLAKRFAVGSVLAHGAALTVLLFSLHWSNFFEPWCLLFGTLALYLYFLKEKRARLLFCGVLTGCAYLTKQNALVWLGVLGLVVLFYESSWKMRVVGGLGLTLGFVIAVLGYAVLLRMANGSWVATSVFFGDNRYTHGLGGVRETVKFILTCAMVLLPLIYLVVKQGVGRSRDVFCFMIASGMVLLILFVSPYHSNLLMGASLFALFFAIFTRDFVALRQGSVGVFCWGGGYCSCCFGCGLFDRPNHGRESFGSSWWAPGTSGNFGFCDSNCYVYRETFCFPVPRCVGRRYLRRKRPYPCQFGGPT